MPDPAPAPQPLVVQQSNLAGFALIAIAIMITGLGGVWIYTKNQPAPAPQPTPGPAPVIVDNFPGLSDALAAEPDKARVKLLRDLWGGLALTTSSSNVQSLIQVQQVNQLAGRIAGLHATNEQARAIVAAGFERLRTQVSDPLDAAERGVVAKLYSDLEQAAHKAL